MSDHEFHEPHHLTVGYVGAPGARTFLLQVEDHETRLTVQLEKAQVSGVAELLAKLLARIGDAPAADVDAAAMELLPPLEPTWRVREVSVGVDDDQEVLLLELAGVGATDDAAAARIWFRRETAGRLAAHAARIVAEGRPRCRLCGRPTEPDGGHVCPSTNGHGPLSA